MTTPLPTPQSAPRSPATPAGPAPAARYTHLRWLLDMVQPTGHIARVQRNLEVMAADLADVKAGRTQRALVDECLADSRELLAWVLQFVASVDADAVPMFEAIQRAGGQHEVAQDKRYHDRG